MLIRKSQRMDVKFFFVRNHSVFSLSLIISDLLQVFFIFFYYKVFFLRINLN